VTVVLAFSIRALLGERRTIALLLFSAAAGAIALLTRAAGDPFFRENDYADLVTQLVIPTVTSFIALVVAASAFGEEREDGSILYLAATPLSRLSLVGAKIVAAWVTTLVLLVPALLGLAVLGQGVEGVGVGIHLYTWLGVALAAAAYCAVFVLLSLSIRRAVIAGILYIALWEGSIATFAASAGRLSIGAYARSIAAEGTPGVTVEGTADVRPLAALIVLAATIALGTWLAARRFRRMELP
jgi:ABC-2 type transport system permease protein